MKYAIRMSENFCVIILKYTKKKLKSSIGYG